MIFDNITSFMLTLKKGKYMKNLIIFDCFGVLLKYDVSYVWLCKNLSAEYTEYLRKEIFPKADRGEISMQELFQLFSDKTKKDILTIQNEFLELSQVNYNMVEFIRELKKDNYVVLLSNCPKGFLNKILTENQLDNLFDKVIISCDYHLIKPDIAIFNVALNSFYGKFNKSIFIDDNIKNIYGAQNAKIDYALYYENFEDTKNELLNILSNLEK